MRRRYCTSGPEVWEGRRSISTSPSSLYHALKGTVWDPLGFHFPKLSLLASSGCWSFSKSITNVAELWMSVGRSLQMSDLAHGSSIMEMIFSTEYWEIGTSNTGVLTFLGLHTPSSEVELEWKIVAHSQPEVIQVETLWPATRCPPPPSYLRLYVNWLYS